MDGQSGEGERLTPDAPRNSRRHPPRGRPTATRPGKHHRQATPDNAGRTAAETTANQQIKPSIQPATTPRTKTRARRHSRPHQGGGHAQARHAPTKGGARTNTAPTPATQTPQATNTRQRRPYGDGDNSEPTKQAEHQAGYNTTNRNPNTPTQQAPPRGGPRTNTARPNRGGGGHAPAQHRPRPSQQHNHNHNPPNRRRQPKPNTTIAAGGHQHSTPQQEGGHAPTQRAPPRRRPQPNAARPTKGGGARTCTAPTLARQTTQTTNTRQCRPYGGGDNSEPTKQPGIQPATTPRTKTRARRHRTPHRGGGHAQRRHAPTGGGGHAPAQHQPLPSQQDNRNHNPPDR